MSDDRINLASASARSLFCPCELQLYFSFPDCAARLRSASSQPPLRGSTIFHVGTGLSENVAQGSYPLTASLAGARLEGDGIPLLIVSADPNQIVAQIPFEMNAGKKILTLGGPDAPLIAIPPQMVVADFLPYWQNGASNGFARHDDLARSPVTFGDPARPGEVISFFLSGMGVVTPPLSSGVLAPTQPLLKVARSFQCVCAVPVRK
jgi:uncharacterized protein (TIGR03437 family)